MKKTCLRVGRYGLALLLLVPCACAFPLHAGTLAFKAAVNYATGSGTFPGSVAIADVNGDGKPDLATANEHSNTVSVLLGNGNGTFQNQVAYATGDTPFSVAIADVNRDGKPDLATTNANSNTVSVLLGNGNGIFQTEVAYATGTAPNSVVIADVNRDGKPDLATANPTSNTVSVLLNGAP